MRYFITGYKGQLGYDLVRELSKRGELDIVVSDLGELESINEKSLKLKELTNIEYKSLDITDKNQVNKVIEEVKPDVIIHCAAWTAVDKAEELEDKVRSVNVEGTKNITDASIAVGAKLIYMSTDYVFDGKKEGYYAEEDKVNPMSVYGKTKFEGEEEVRRNPKHFITRISWVFGINGNNFIKTMVNLSEKFNELNVVDDQVGSPTYTVDLSKILIDMAHTDKYGTYHVNNDGYCSWAEFAKYIFESNGLDTKVNPVSTEEYIELMGITQAYRPRNSKLSKEKLVEAGFEMLPSWQDATDRYCQELSNNNPVLRKSKKN